MNKFWQVARHEYQRHVFTRRFVLVGFLSVPLFILVMGGLILLIFSLEVNTTPIGYVDHSGLLADSLPAPDPEPPGRPISMLPFENETAALSAMEAGQIQAYYVIPGDYLSTGNLNVFHLGAIKSPAISRFYAFLEANLLRNTSPEISNRIEKGAEIIYQSLDGSRSLSSDNWVMIVLPMVIGIVFMIAMFSTGGYLMHAVVEEKENRTMEVIITSVSPNQFMAGKIIGDIASGLTQIFLWMLFIFLPIFLFRNSVPLLKGIQIGTQTLLLVSFVMLPAFIVVSALMAAIGATVSEAREGQQMVGLVSLPVWIPYMLTGLLMTSPNSPLALGLSLFPLTAPLTMLMRDAITILPAWQIALSAIIQVASAVGAIWLASRAFRMGMLRTGQPLKWSEIFKRQVI
jgi:ABC-2 type transport system permease protein